MKQTAFLRTQGLDSLLHSKNSWHYEKIRENCFSTLHGFSLKFRRLSTKCRIRKLLDDDILAQALSVVRAKLFLSPFEQRESEV